METTKKKIYGLSDFEIKRKLHNRLNKLGSIKTSEVWNMLKDDGYPYNKVCDVFNSIMNKKVEAGEAEKIANGLYWIKRNQYCLN